MTFRRLPGCALLLWLTQVGCSSEQHGMTGMAGGAFGQAGEASSVGGAGAGAGTSAIGGASSDAGTSSVTGGSAAGGSSGTSSSGGAAGGSSAGGSAGASAAGGAGYWKPRAGTTWQWQLTGTIDTTIDVDVYDIDGFDNDAAVVKGLHEQGRKVICYISVGSYEDWRPDAKNFPAAALGKDYPGWPGERFIDIRAQAVRKIMASRFDGCKNAGFDGIEPDNMDVYGADSGFPLTPQDGVEYAQWLAEEAHARGLNIGQKNAPEITSQIQPVLDWALTEDCFDQSWCADVSAYVDHDKPVFMAEYTDTKVDFSAACTWAKPKKFSPILKGRDLDAPVQFCK